MPLIFLGLAIAGIIALGAESATGILMHRAGSDYSSFHTLFGMFAGLFLCLLHTIAMFHLIGSGKDLKEFIKEKELPEADEILGLLSDIKKKSFPIITLTVLVTVAAPVTGASTKYGSNDLLIHQIAIIATLLMNLIAFWIEFVAIRNNFGLMLYADIKQQEREEKSSKEGQTQ